MDKEAQVMKLLEDLIRMDDVLACMVAKRGLEGGLSPETIKLKDLTMWRLLDNTTDDFFQIISRFYDYGMDRIYFELGKYTVILAAISSKFALIVLIPGLSNRGLIDVEVENTKRKIEQIIQQKDEEETEIPKTQGSNPIQDPLNPSDPTNEGNV